jgi:hypothetical protein
MGGILLIFQIHVCLKCVIVMIDVTITYFRHACQVVISLCNIKLSSYIFI